MDEKIKALLEAIEAIVNDESMTWREKVKRIENAADNDLNAASSLEEFTAWFFTAGDEKT